MWTHRFSLVMPKVLEAELTVRSGPLKGKHRGFPFWPAGARLNTTPADGLSGRLVYIGEGSPGRAPGHLPARSLRGQIAVMEMTGGERWMDAFNAGAKAVIVLGSPEVTTRQACTHLVGISLNVPRFYVPDGPLAEALRDGRASDGKLYCRATWGEVTATNIYALIKPPSPAETIGNRQAFVIGVPYDSMSVVPELAPGADRAVDVAAALNLLRYFAEHPPARPLLVAFVDAYASNQRGAREMLAALATVPEDREGRLSDAVEVAREYREHEELAAELHPDPEVPATREGLNRLYERRYRDLRRYLKDEVARQVVAIESMMYPKRLALYRTDKESAKLKLQLAQLVERSEKAGGEKKEHLRAEVEKLQTEISRLLKAHRKLKKETGKLATLRTEHYGAQRQLHTDDPVEDDSLELARELWRRARTRIAIQLKDAEHVLSIYRKRDQLRVELLEALGLAGETERPIAFVFGLDLSDAGAAVGPRFQDTYLYEDETYNAESFFQWMNLVKQETDDKLWPRSLRRVVNLAPISGMESVGSDTVGWTVNFTAPAGSFGTAGVTWAALGAPCLRVDTPYDSADRLDWGRLEPQVGATSLLLRRMLSDTRFSPSTKSTPQWSRVHGTIVDQSPGEPVPRVPMRGYLTTLVPGGVSVGNANVWFKPVPGMRRREFRFTGIDGRFRFDALPSRAQTRGFFVQSYLVDTDGSLVRAVDMRKSGMGVTMWVDIWDTNPGLLRAVVFDCAELSALDFFDPRFLIPLPGGSLMDARRASEPRRQNVCAYEGLMACHLEADIQWQIILRHGITSNRMALLNMADPKTLEGDDVSMRDVMKGFKIGEPLPLNPVHQGAKDFYRLDYMRLRDYERAGITSAHIKKLQQRTAALLKEADAALEEDDGKAYVEAASGALSNEVRVYQAVRKTANDVIKGAIFLLMVIVPFSLVMERLCFASANIYKQIGAVSGVFAVMAALLWSFHPAFRITSQPLMILMAFGAISMSLMVIWIVFSKFETQLEELRSGRAEASGARTSRLGLAYTAMRLGIANMRKRKLRTVLTGITVVLITFALLCFMSASSYVSKKEMTRARSAPYAGVLVALPATRPMPDRALAELEKVVPENHSVVPRYWWVNPTETQWRIRVRNAQTGRQVSLKAVLGLVAEESELTGVDSACPNWSRFGNKNGCYLAEGTAEELGLEPGDKVVLAGRSLELLGTIDSDKFSQTVRRLDGSLLLPYDFTAVSDQQRLQLTKSNLEELTMEMSTGAALEPTEEMPNVSVDSVAIVHASVLRGMRDCNLRSVSVKLGSHTEARELAQELMKRLAFPIYYGSPEHGVRVIVSTPLLLQAPRSILIPVVIAALIILNTMLSSIAERKTEIYIYTSLGLAPLHVGFLFLAEAVTYGLMGSVFGYVAGQGVAKVLTELDLMGGITLNYSGTQAIITMLTVLGVVIVSSLVPAFLAGKLATPSNEMTWKVPEPENDVIRDRLPFTATERTAGGVLEFLYEYMDAHREGSIGKFSADNLRKFYEEEGGTKNLGLEGTVWLAPYDLGVRQDVRITLHSTPEEDIYKIDIELHRRSGQVSSWKRLNRVLLGNLRRQLLGWRKLKIDRMLEYIVRAGEEAPQVQAQAEQA